MTPRADGAPGLRVDSNGVVFGSVAAAAGAAPVSFIASPNCDERPAGTAVDLLVIHGISLPPGRFGGPAIEALFTNTLDPAADPSFLPVANLRVSAHFLIRRDGRLIQFVPCAKRAWHAGVSAWGGRVRCNDFSIGIELEGADDVAYEPAQYDVLAALTGALAKTFPLREVVGHSDIAPGRKTDPGPFFDWRRYRSAVGVNLTFPTA